MRTHPAHEDLGLDPAADKTPDLKPGKSESPEVAASEDSEPSTHLRTER